MTELRLSKKHQSILNDFVLGLQRIYPNNLSSVVLYGSAASGEFIDKHSNINLLVVLKDVGLDNLKLASGLVNKWGFRLISSLFLSEDYILSSLDVFPIEFLDMKENYVVLFGKDFLAGLSIDARNLRFQCEHELKAKLIALKQVYLRENKNRRVLENVLFRSFISIIHILRSALRIKGKQVSYSKENVLGEITKEFSIDVVLWGKILAARNKKTKYNFSEIDTLFLGFVKDLEKIVVLVDNF